MREFFAITLPSLRHEIGVCVTVTVIAALSAFDIVYISTRGGPATRRWCPLQIYEPRSSTARSARLSLASS